MTSLFAPTVPIGRLQWDAAQYVLQGCRPERQSAALPYLLAMYSFMAWWEDREDSRELSLSTTWCEQPEVLDLVNIADLNIEGLQLAFYPVEVGQTNFEIHCPTFLGVVHGDLAVAVELSRQDCWARLLGFIDRANLVQFWRTTPPDAQGFSQVPLSQLQSIYYLPEQISYLQPALPPASPVVQRKTNLNQTPAETAPTTTVTELTEKLLQLGVTPNQPTPLGTPVEPVAVTVKGGYQGQSGNGIQRLVQALQVYSNQGSTVEKLKKS